MSKKQVFALFLSLILFLISCAYNPKQNSLDVVSTNTSTDIMYLYVIADLKTFDNNYYLCSENIIKHCVNNDFPSTKFSYDLSGCPNKITAYVYSSAKDFKLGNPLFTMYYYPKSSDNTDHYNIKDNFSEYTFDISY